MNPILQLLGTQYTMQLSYSKYSNNVTNDIKLERRCLIEKMHCCKQIQRRV